MKMIENKDEDYEMNVQTLIDMINSIQLEKCEDIRCGDMLYYVVKGKQDRNPFRDLLSSIKAILKIICFDDVKITSRGKPDTVFLFSNSYRGRKDHLQNFKNVCDISENHILVEPGEKFLKFHKGYIFLIHRWSKQMSSCIPNRGLRLYILSGLLKAYSDYEYVQKYIREKNLNIRTLVTFCDVHAIDSYFTQRGNAAGITTVTLQHGVFTAKVNYWPFSGSYSQYFLASNALAVEEAKLLNYKKTMMIAGLYSYVNRELPVIEDTGKIKTIGVFLDTEAYRTDNIKTLKVVEEYQKIFGKKIRIKFHPASVKESYENFTNRIEGAECVGNEMNVVEFCKTVDVVIVRNSTTLIEALQFGKPTYIIHNDDQEDDIFANVDILKFSTAEELHKIIDLQSSEQIHDQLIEARKYFCSEGDITEKYRSIFRKIGIS